MRLLYLGIWGVFIPLLFVASCITYIVYIIVSDKRVLEVFSFYLDYFSIPKDIIFKDYFESE